MVPAHPSAEPCQTTNIEFVVSALGMVSPVGANATQTFTSIRANIPRKQERPDIYMCLPADPDTDQPEPLTASAISHLDCRWRAERSPTEWLALLAANAFADLWGKAKLTAGEEIGLFLALPASRPDWGRENQERFANWFHNLVARDRFVHEQFVWLGSCGVLALCADACRLLREGKIQHAIIGGVDSHLFPRWLEPLDRAYRIHSTRNLDGFCPGEAAALLLLESAAKAGQRSLRPWAEMRTIASATYTPGPAGHDAGMALADVLRHVIPAQAKTPPLVVCDLNGELSRAREWGHALARLGKALPGPLAIEHPAAVLGDVGAATGAVLLVTAAHALHTKHSERNSAVVWAASDGGERCAVLLERSLPPSGSPLSP
jgi:3-oxoacyl-[acyl-carrier-protein] synthase-1